MSLSGWLKAGDFIGVNGCVHMITADAATDAGGAAVIAHPARYKFTANEEHALFTEFKAHGGLGVEVVTGSHSAAEAVRYGEAAL